MSDILLKPAAEVGDCLKDRKKEKRKTERKIDIWQNKSEIRKEKYHKRKKRKERKKDREKKS